MRRIPILLAILTGLYGTAPRRVWAQASATCSVTPVSYAESFNSTTYRDASNTSAQGWGGGTGIKLSQKAGAFPTPSTNPNFAERVYAIVSDDFDGDGDEDLVVLSDTGGCHLDIFLSNGLPSGTFTNKGQIATCSSTSAAVLAAGDIDGDGKNDIVFATVNNPMQAGTINTAVVLRNNGNVLGKPAFISTNIATLLQNAGVSWHVGGNQMVLQDNTADGRDDLIVLSSTGTTSQVLMFAANPAGQPSGFSAAPTVLVSDAALATPIAKSGVSATGGYVCEPTLAVSKGGSALGARDLDGDGLMDLVVGSVSENDLKYFVQNSDGTFARQTDIKFTQGGALMTFVRDMDNDGSPDLVVFRSGNDCNGGPGLAAIYFNDGQGNFTNYQNYLGVGGTIAFAAVLNVDNDSQGTADVIAGRLNGVGLYIYYKNTASTSVYNMTSKAQSKALATLDATTTGVVSVKVTGYSATTPNGTTLTMQVSNDGGAHWEVLTSAELTGGTGNKEHTFSSFGADIRWKAVLTAPMANLTGSSTPYTPGASVTPLLSQFAFTYYTVGRNTFTRSGLTRGVFTQNGSPVEALFYATFDYPGFTGYLRAINVNALGAGTAPAGTLQRVDNSNQVTQMWEAGAQLASRGGGARTLYTAYPIAVTSDPNTVRTGRIAFTSAEATAGSSTPNLSTMMGINALTSGQKTSLVNWLVGGMGRADGWKLLDPGHSSPVFIGKPSGDSNYFGAGYDAFVTQQASRQAAVLLGANDGMLHAFSANTGAEMWGFVPYNLLAKMKTQQGIDASGNATYNHDFFVDGPITVADVYAGNAWHTVAIVGQAAGQGLLGNNYYFALEVTDPLNPQPLWEFSDVFATPRPGCDLSKNTAPSCIASCTTNSSSCTSECGPWGSNFVVSSATPDPSGGASGYIEAENFDSETSGTPTGDWNVTSGPLLGTKPGNVNTGSGYMMTGTASGTCGGTDTASQAPCTMLTYRFNAAAAGTYYVYLRMYRTGNSDDQVSWGIDGVFSGIARGTATPNNWNWDNQNRLAVSLGAGDHVLNVWQYDSGRAKVDAIVIQQSKTSDPTTTTQTCNQLCAQTCSSNCSTVTYSSPSNTEWPQCGVGSGLQCCGSQGGDQYCAPTGSTCAAPESIMGATYSPPAIGRVNTTNGGKWVAFFASGYNNRNGIANVGRSVYAVDAFTGALMGQWDVDRISQLSPNPNIDNTVPGGVALADVNDDGFVDRVYFGDLDGRLWKINTSSAAALNGVGKMTSSAWSTCVLFDAGNPTGSGNRVWAPIVTKPAVAVLNPNSPNVYFGTGGDDRAPDNILYKFYSVRDDDTLSQCRPSGPKREGNLSIAQLEWVVGDGKKTDGSPLSNPNDEGTVGDRYWADPVVDNGVAIYFVSLPGKIESASPCVNLQGSSKVYGYAIQQFKDAAGVSHPPGTSFFTAAYLQSLSKVRAAPMLRNPPPSTVPHGPVSPVTQAKSDVFFQNASGAVQRTTTAGAVVQSPLRILRWREIPL